MCCVLQPWTDGFEAGLEPVLFGYLFSILAGILAAIDIIILQRYRLCDPVEKANATMFWLYLTGTILSLIGVLVNSEITISTALIDWILVFVHSISFGLIIIISIYCFPCIPSVIVTLILSTSTVHMVVAQYTFMARYHRGNHNLLEMFGVGIVLISSTYPSVITAVRASKQNISEES